MLQDNQARAFHRPCTSPLNSVDCSLRKSFRKASEACSNIILVKRGDLIKNDKAGKLPPVPFHSGRHLHILLQQTSQEDPSRFSISCLSSPIVTSRQTKLVTTHYSTEVLPQLHRISQQAASRVSPCHSSSAPNGTAPFTSSSDAAPH